MRDDPVVLYLVDLPSDPRQPRAEIAATARRHLDTSTAPSADIVLGDFNMTRGSASLRRIFPGFRHAYDEAGTGYGATFRRDWPMYHIDHVLLGPDVEATSYELRDPGVARHRAQFVTVNGPSGTGTRSAPTPP
jgi:endonuclease/exonuclease/phosphatase family metal-dependent hydrolase